MHAGMAVDIPGLHPALHIRRDLLGLLDSYSEECVGPAQQPSQIFNPAKDCEDSTGPIHGEGEGAPVSEGNSDRMPEPVQRQQHHRFAGCLPVRQQRTEARKLLQEVKVEGPSPQGA